MDNLRFAVVCSSNMNRSMEAHAILAKKGFKVKSFGTGEKVKLPGSSPDRPNYYNFGVPYIDIYNDLVEKDKTFYAQTGLLNMLDRNHRIKPGPERFQSSKERFDVIITCEEIIYHQVLEWFMADEPVCDQYVHIVNIDVEDNPGEATIGSYLITDLVTMMAHSEDLDQDIDEILNTFETKTQQDILNCIMFY